MKFVKVQLLILIIALFTFGCQNSGELVETSQSPFCTSCKTETKTTSIKGFNKKYYKCPKCEQNRPYYGWEESHPLHTCSKCGKAFKQCSICKDQNK